MDSVMRVKPKETLYGELAEKILAAIEQEALWGRQLPPERELSLQFGVGRRTIRRSLELLERRCLVMRKNRSATLVLPRRKQPAERATLGGEVVVVGTGDGLRSKYLNEILVALAESVDEADLTLSFGNLYEPLGRRSLFEKLRGGAPAGVLLVSLDNESLAREVLEAWSGPTVAVDHFFPSLPVSCVLDDSAGGARQGTEHLLQLGHRRIAYVDATYRRANPWRYAGYAAALEAFGLEVNPDLVINSRPTLEAAAEAGRKLLASHKPPTAILAFDQTRGYGVWRAAEEAGMVVGRDLAIVSHGPVQPLGLGREPEMSTVTFESAEVGMAAVRKLRQLMANNSRKCEEVLIPTRLVIGRSSRDARKGDPR
jgi:LacI family transcriptional regulator, galactose operon repressor